MADPLGSALCHTPGSCIERSARMDDLPRRFVIRERLPLPELIESFGLLGCDVVEMVLADQDGWDRYAAASWLNIRRWLDANPHDELADDMRAELASSPARYARYRREYLGWGVFALMNR
jgi:hypothetical protein